MENSIYQFDNKELKNEENDIAICCMSGGYKNVFTQGVLKAFEENDFKAKVYAACSSSVLIAAYAAISKIKLLDLSVWNDGYITSQENGNQSEAMLQSIQKLAAEIQRYLWQADSSRLLIATSLVKTEEAAAITQSDGAKRLGQMLLINALRHKSDWKDNNLKLQIFDTCAKGNNQLLTEDNFNEVAYASTRMLHAWNIPAFINNQAYVDGSYTSLCPVIPLTELGYKNILCICTEKDKVVYDLFSDEEIPSLLNGAKIEFIKPDCELKNMGVDFYTITGDGLDRVFEYGYNRGIDYIKKKH